MSANPITKAINLVGLGALAKGLRVSGQAIRKWEAAGRLPRSEWTGETHYSRLIEGLTLGGVTVSDLLGTPAIGAPTADLRDEFAKAALPIVLEFIMRHHQPLQFGSFAEAIASGAYQLADAMLVEREAKPCA